MVSNSVSAKIIIFAIISGVIFGGILGQLFNDSAGFNIAYDTVDTGSMLFLRLLKMLVIPVVSISIMCGVSQMDDARKIGSMGVKTFLLYVITTAIAIGIAMFVAILFKVGSGLSFGQVQELELSQVPSIKDTIVQWIPDNPISAMVNNNMLQVILFSTLIGIAIINTGAKGQKTKEFVHSLNEVLITWVMLIMRVVPIGVFCLMTKLAMTTGINVIKSLGLYAICVLLALGSHVVIVYGLLLSSVKINPINFLKKMWPAQLFAFSVSSSSASIPVVLNTVRNVIGVKEEVANFVIPLGATINMDGTAIMQGVATVFIANAYQIQLSAMDLITIMSMATVASVGTAGVPGVGLITLAMVLEQVGVPVEGIALIVGIDRILDMVRTAVNITGDATVATVVDRQ